MESVFVIGFTITIILLMFCSYMSGFYHGKKNMIREYLQRQDDDAFYERLHAYLKQNRKAKTQNNNERPNG